ncbi:glycosyl hydrolase family 47-domain-containing protein [Lipomyces oligophaga]|uniref:glycosyl hydrolase family 47-domain-containing protein n=1 Tax=Lipomyces oligophaga TaxID=45792 RepID=UPI0034CD6BE6
MEQIEEKAAADAAAAAAVNDTSSAVPTDQNIADPAIAAPVSVHGTSTASPQANEGAGPSPNVDEVQQESQQRPAPVVPPVQHYESTISPDDLRGEEDTLTTPVGVLSDTEIMSKPIKIKFPVTERAALPQTPALNFPKIQVSSISETPEEKSTREDRRAFVKSAFTRSWESYKKYAWGHDELLPVTAGFSDTFGGWGASIIDTIDTLIIMDLTSELDQVKTFLESLDFSKMSLNALPVFEVTIRYLGGLISAYDLSPTKDQIYLQKATELANILAGAFDTPNGMPIAFYDPKLAHSDVKLRAGKHVVFAQFGSLSLEFTRLAQLTQNSSYYSLIQRVTDQIDTAMDSSDLPGLWPVRMDISGCKAADVVPEQVAITNGAISTEENKDLQQQSQATDNSLNEPAPEVASTENAPSQRRLKKRQEVNAEDPVVPDSKTQLPPIDWQASQLPYAAKCDSTGGLVASAEDNEVKYSAGALGDSAYEYFIKEYLLLGGTVDQYKRLYTSSSRAIKENLLYRPLVEGNPDVLFTGNILVDKSKNHHFDSEMTHLSCYLGGMFALGAQSLEKPDDLKIAEKLAEGCYWSYKATRTGVMPENFHVRVCDTAKCEWQDPTYEQQVPTNSQKRNLRKRQEQEQIELGAPSDQQTTETSQADPNTESGNTAAPPVADTPAENTVDSSSEGTIGEQATVEIPDQAKLAEPTTEEAVNAPIGEQPAGEISEQANLAEPSTEETINAPQEIKVDDAETPVIASAETSINGQSDVAALTAPAEALTNENPVPASEIPSEAPVIADPGVTDAATDAPADAPPVAPEIVSTAAFFKLLAEIKAKETAAEQAAAQGEQPPPLQAEVQVTAEDEAAAQNDFLKYMAEQKDKEASIAAPADTDAAPLADTQEPPAVSEEHAKEEAAEKAAQEGQQPPAQNSEIPVTAEDQSAAEAEFFKYLAEQKLKEEQNANDAVADGNSTNNALANVAHIPSPTSYTHQMINLPEEIPANRWSIGGWYDQPKSFLSQDGKYLLRPEALESIFIMYRVTGDKKWQDKGWEMFSAIEKYCKTEYAYSAIKDVTNDHTVTFSDNMESFWLAETLKYAYLLFSDPELISLDSYVFNTEAHPFLRPSPLTDVPAK